MIKSFLQGVVRKLCNQGWGVSAKDYSDLGESSQLITVLEKGWSGK